MAFSNIDNLPLGQLLQIIFTKGVHLQQSSSFKDWEYVQSKRGKMDPAREVRFLFQKSLGPSAVQYRNPGTTARPFPRAQRATVSENSAKFKEIQTTIELDYSIWDRARKSPTARYIEPLAMEISSKTTASKRQLAKDLYGDGTGVLGTSDGAADDTNIATGEVVVTISDAYDDRGFIGWFEYDELILAYEQDGTPRNPTGGTFSAYRVKQRNRRTNTLTLEVLDANGAVSTSATASNIADTDVFYKIGQPTIPDLTAPVADYGTLTEVMVGLEALTANDGRTVHGIEMEGSCAGSRFDQGGSAFDLTMIQDAMDDTKIRVGQDRYSWKMACMDPRVRAKVIDSREDDRRFNSYTDHTRGVTKFVYQHDNDPIEFHTGEYTPVQKTYIMPEGKQQEKVLEYWGTDFETVKTEGGDSFHLLPDAAGGYNSSVVSYLQAYCVLVCNHPAAIPVLTNYSL